MKLRNHLKISKETMKRNYDKSVQLNEYNVGDQVWLRKKCYKAGESKKLSPRRTGPWTILEKLPNGVNFKIKRNGSNEEKVIHHNRLYPKKCVDRKSYSARNVVQSDDTSLSAHYSDDSSSSSSRATDDESEDNAIVNDGNNERRSRYPLRNRVLRKIPGTIPWSALRI